MEQLLTLFIFSLAMFLGCYVAGSIPLVLSLSETVLRKVTVFGAGLLVGTALIIIIPEGIESLYNTDTSLHSHEIDTKSLQIFPLETADLGESPLKNEIGIHLMGLDDEAEHDEQHLQFFLGLSLVLGFVFMLVIDQFSGSHSHGGSGDIESGVTQRRGRMTATIGLVVHAAADGLALGAAAGLSKTDVEFVIFIAIMLHKAPAAFGFTSFLIHEGYDKQTAKYHLLVFALAAPIAAVVSYFGLIRIMYAIQIPITGITMLFSAGTFLYVSTVHVLNEVTHNHKLNTSEVVVIVTGALLPLVFNFTHSH